MRVTVYGAGYVGLVNAAVLLQGGHEVTVVENDLKKLDMLKKGGSPFFEAGLFEMLRQFKERLFYSQVAKEADFAIICVNTPRVKGVYDMGAVYACAKSAGELTHVIIRTTVLPNTTSKIAKMRKGKTGYMPEFLVLGEALKCELAPNRTVIGSEDFEFANSIIELYNAKNSIITTALEAEIIKLASNSFLALKVTYGNQLALFCKNLGASYENVKLGVGSDPRIGQEHLDAGMGFGGSCLPKDIEIFEQISRHYGCGSLLSAVSAINCTLPDYYFNRAMQYCNNKRRPTVAILGMAFKQGADDLRCSPSMKLANQFARHGCRVQVYDQLCTEMLKSDNRFVAYSTPNEALSRADVCIICNKDAQIEKLTPYVFLSNMNRPIVLDARRCYDKELMHKVGVIYEPMG